MPRVPPICPYCKEEAEFVDTAEIYGGRSYGNAWLCRACDAYVGAHDHSGLPKGTLVNAEGRKWRMRAHAAFDPLWQSVEVGRARARKDAYGWLARALDIPFDHCHIGQFDVATCRKVVQLCKEKEPPPSEPQPNTP